MAGSLKGSKAMPTITDLCSKTSGSQELFDIESIIKAVEKADMKHDKQFFEVTKALLGGEDPLLDYEAAAKELRVSFGTMNSWANGISAPSRLERKEELRTWILKVLRSIHSTDNL